MLGCWQRPWGFVGPERAGRAPAEPPAPVGTVRANRKQSRRARQALRISRTLEFPLPHLLEEALVLLALLQCGLVGREIGEILVVLLSKTLLATRLGRLGRVLLRQGGDLLVVHSPL